MAEYIEREAVCTACGGSKYKLCSPDCILFDVPTADVVERKRGEWWIEDDGFGCELMTCSVCKASFYDGDNDTVDSPHNFCPNCGCQMVCADMRSHQNILCDHGERRNDDAIHKLQTIRPRNPRQRESCPR